MRVALAVLAAAFALAASAAGAPRTANKRPSAKAAAEPNQTQNKAAFPKPDADSAPTDKAAPSDKGEDTRAAARQMAREAIALMHDSRWTEAEALLERAYRLVPAPTVALLDGRCLEELGKLTEAAGRYEAATKPSSEGASDAFRKAAEEAARRLAEIRERIPKIAIVLEGDHLDEKRVVLLIDSKPLAHDDWSKPVLVDPGNHVVAASVDGRVAVEDQVMLKEGESKQVSLRLHGDAAPPPPPAVPAVVPEPARVTSPAPSSSKTWGFVSLGIGGAGLATGIVSGVVMLDAKSSLDVECSPVCPPAATDEISRFRTARVVSAIGYGVGIVGIGVGAAILLLSPGAREDERAARLRVVGDLHTVGVEGTF